MHLNCLRRTAIPALLLAAAFSARPAAAPLATNPPAASNAPAAAHADPVENSVVKVFATIRTPDYFKPWTKASPSEVSGSGVVIEGKRILSNAHVVNYASQVEIQASQGGDKISASVVAIYPGIDLAILKLDDESFFDTHAPLPRAKTLPQIKDAVMVYGYPTGGSTLSITKGIVSRIEFAAYNYPIYGLRVQIDAAINPGNSGGPAVAGDKMIGLAFSRLVNAENIGYIIPCEEIELFLKNVAAGRPESKPGLLEDYQTLENAALRKFLKVDKSVHGIVVNKPGLTETNYPLHQWDVITRIGDTPVDDQGMIALGDLRVSFMYQLQNIVQDGKIPLTIARGPQELKFALPAQTNDPLLIPALNGAYPSYFVYGPIVFSTVTREFLRTLRADSPSATAVLVSVGSPLVKRAADREAFPGERLVVVSSPFFPHKLCQGYTSPFAEVVKKINGVTIKNLDHLVEVLRDCKDEMVTFEFDSQASEILVFPRAEMVSATDEILTDNGVRSQGSPDTLAIWNAKKSNN